MARMKDIDTFKRDNALMDFLKKKRGKENVTSSKEIATYLNSLGYVTSSTAVHSMVNRIREERSLPICYMNSKGYFWAKSLSEIKSTIADIDSRIQALTEHKNQLQSFLFEE